jgi:hypothetical protein
MNVSKKRGNYSSLYKGVSWDNSVRKWLARIQVAKKNMRLGYFKCEQDAALAYNEAATKYYGAFAKLNEF